MRQREACGGVSVHAISGTHVVTLGFDVSERRRRGLLGFSIYRIDHTEDEAYFLKGFKTFEAIQPFPSPGALYSQCEHPVQSFLWGDYSAKPDHDYSYRVFPVYGRPKRQERGDPVEVCIRTESEAADTHAIFFNRGVAGSQAYVRRFGDKRPDELPDDSAYRWLSRGLEEALIAFIGQANGPRFGLRAAVYEFNYAPVLEAFAAAHASGADLSIVYDARREPPRDSTQAAARQTGIEALLIPRATHSSYISHNKFILLLEDGRPVQVWTGSTNFTRGGIFGQANLGHLVRDPAVAQQYLNYWEELAKDPQNRDLRPLVEAATPVADDLPEPGSSVIFSPRSSLEALDWYAQRMDAADNSLMLTAAFGVNKRLAAVLNEDRDFLRYLLLETRGDNYDIYAADPDVVVSIGSNLQQETLYRWTKEQLTGFNLHVRYIHTKFMLVDPLSDDPLVISGSANFSDASTKNNDENMLVIRGDKRVADIYLGEFMRLFNHHYFRYHANRLRHLDQANRKQAFLAEDDTWSERYFRAGSKKMKQRLLFA